MKTSKQTSLVIAACIGFWSLSAHAEMYKCLNKAGKTIYQANKCPVDAKTSVVKEADKIKQAKPAPAKPKTLDSVIAEGKQAAAEMDKKIKATSEEYDAKIALLNKQKVPTYKLETEKNLALKDLYTEKTKAYKSNLAEVKIEEKKIKSQTAAIEKKIADIKAKKAEETAKPETTE